MGPPGSSVAGTQDRDDGQSGTSNGVTTMPSINKTLEAEDSL